MKSHLAEMVRGYATNEYSHPTRSRDENRLDLTPWTDDDKARVALYAERNFELHKLGHDMLNALEYLDCDYDTLHKFRERLHNVPQCRHAPE